MTCLARSNKTIPCDGEFVPSEGLCLRHAVLFDYWIAEKAGFRVYHSAWPLGWKRQKFHQWLNRLTLEDAKKIMESK